MIDSSDPAIAALVEEWNNDRELRRRVPARESWRGCLGIAALFDSPERIPHGQRLFVRNDHLRWAALRDIPPGHFGNRLPGKSHAVNFATLTRASLQYGMPKLDFSHDAIVNHDHRFAPVSRDAL